MNKDDGSAKRVKLNKDGTPRKLKVLQKPSMVSRLAFLEIGECDYFPVVSTLQGILNSIQAVLTKSRYLEGMKFSTKRYLMVREDEPVAIMVKVTRVK